MNEQDIILSRLKSGEAVVVKIRGYESIVELCENVFKISLPSVLSSTTVVLKGYSVLMDDALTDVYNQEGEKILQGVYVSRFTLPEITNRTLNDYL